ENAGTPQRIASDCAVTDRCHRREGIWIEVALSRSYFAENLDFREYLVCGLCVAGRVERSSSRRHCKRRAADLADDGVELPSPCQPGRRTAVRPALSGAEGHFVNAVDLQIVGAVKASQRAIPRPLRHGMESQAGIAVIRETDSLRESVRQANLRAMSQSARHLGLQRIVGCC